MSNRASDFTKRELCVLNLVSGTMPICADASWLAFYGDGLIEGAEMMADKLIEHWQSKEFVPFVDKGTVSEGVVDIATATAVANIEPDVESEDAIGE